MKLFNDLVTQIKLKIDPEQLSDFEKILCKKMPEQTSRLKDAHIFYQCNNVPDDDCYLALDWENGDEGSITFSRDIFNTLNLTDLICTFEHEMNQAVLKAMQKEDRNSYMLNGNLLTTKVLYILIESDNFNLYSEVFISDAEAEDRRDKLARKYIEENMPTSLLANFDRFEDIAHDLFHDHGYQLMIHTKILK